MTQDTKPCASVPFGSYQNTTLLPRPKHMYPTQKSDWITVDNCLVPEILDLWREGVWTLECCCGHCQQEGYIAVHDSSVQRMQALGYERTAVQPDRADLFKPKSDCITRAERKDLPTDERDWITVDIGRECEDRKRLGWVVCSAEYRGTVKMRPAKPPAMQHIAKVREKLRIMVGVVPTKEGTQISNVVDWFQLHATEALRILDTPPENAKPEPVEGLKEAISIANMPSETQDESEAQAAKAADFEDEYGAGVYDAILEAARRYMKLSENGAPQPDGMWLNEKDAAIYADLLAEIPNDKWKEIVARHYTAAELEEETRPIKELIDGLLKRHAKITEGSHE